MKLLTALLALMLVGLGDAFGRNVDLSTVPKRDTVQLTIYNSEDLTLVRETRKMTFKKGQNPLQFSWANTLIDPTSVELKFLANVDQLEVLDTTFPQDKPQMLYWNVQSGWDGEATIEISYFTSGITWSADYQCTATNDEGHVSLDGFVRVTNNSGEEYENAQVRLVVGTINLVEKIAQLAQIPMDKVAELQEQEKKTLGERVLARSVDIWMQINGADVFRRVDDGAARIDINSSVAGWDDHYLFSQSIRNHSAKPIEVEVRRSFDGHAVFRSALDPTLHDYRTVQFQTNVEAGRKADLLFELITHQGRNSKQNNVTLEKATLAR